jgi:hypothetical protein
MFDLPQDLKILTKKALQDFSLMAAAARDEILDATTAETVTDEQIEELEQLKNFSVDIDAELKGRQERAARFNAATAEAEVEEEEPEAAAEPAAEAAPAAEAEAEPEAVTAGSAKTPRLQDVINVSNNGNTAVDLPVSEAVKNFTFIAAPDTGFAAGAELDGWDDITKAFVNRSRTHTRGAPAQHHNFALIKREFGDLDILESDSDQEQMRKVDLVRTPDDDALLAGVGWCAPSETIYTTCSQVTATGLISVPEIGARRGGIRHNQGIQFDTIFGGGTGFNILTEAQVIADTVKTCVPIPCPEFIDDRLKVAVLCLTGDILQDRAYPEFVKTFIQGAVATQAHNVNRQIIADMISDSTAVTFTGQPWTSDGSVLSQHMAAVDVAATDIRYRLRLDPNANLEIKLPLWFKAQLRADYLRQNARVSDDLADSIVMKMYSDRNVSPQFVYDWQDAFALGASAGYPGADVPINSLPTEVSWLIYPAGTWVVARLDVIRLDTIYDSTNITTNKVTELFVEDGFKAMRFCPISRVYTHTICPNGSTGVQRAVTCS